MKVFKDTDMIDFFQVMDFIFTIVRGAALGAIVGGVVSAAVWLWR